MGIESLLGVEEGGVDSRIPGFVTHMGTHSCREPERLHRVAREGRSSGLGVEMLAEEPEEEEPGPLGGV